MKRKSISTNGSKPINSLPVGQVGGASYLRKISLLISSTLLLCSSIMAQMPANRTVQTIVADVLAQLPADNQNKYNELIKDLTTTGEEGVLALVGQMNSPGQGSNAQIDYALSGMSHFVTEEGQSSLRTMLENAYAKALEQNRDREIKAFIIRQLGICGTDASIEKLAVYLNREELSGPASRAIASIGSEKAGQALMASLKSRMGTVKTQQDAILALSYIPFVNGAEKLIKGYLNSDNTDMRKATLYTLSKIGTKASLADLAKAAESVGYKMEKTGANDANIILIKRVIEWGDVTVATKAANDLLKKSTKAGQADTRIAAMQLTMSAAVKKRKATSKILMTALKDPCTEYRNAALDAVSPVADKELYTKLLKASGKMKTPELVDVINWIGREAQCPQKRKMLNSVEVRIEKTGVQYLMELLNKSNNFKVKQATAKALVNIGNRQAVSALADLLKSSDKEIVALGKESLATFKGEVTPAIAKVIPAAGDQGKIAAVELLAMRRATNFLNVVLDLTKSDTKDVKEAAYAALKDVAGEKDITHLCGMLESADPSTAALIQQALVASMSSQTVSQQVETIMRRMLQSGDSKKHLYYRPLSTTGENRALSMIVDGYENGKGDAKDAAFAALLNWEGLEVMNILYAIAEDSGSVYAKKALDSYIKLASNPKLSGENRLIYLRNAMEIAKTDMQKNAILAQVSRTGTYLALLYAGEFIDQPVLKENAALAVMKIALAHREYTGELVVNLLNKAAAALSNPDADYQRQSIRLLLEEMPKEKGFVSLFNGKDLTGWKGLVENPIVRAKMTAAQLAKAQEKADHQMRKDWKVENGLLVFDGTGYDNLCSEKQYGDIEMYVDWKLDPAGPEADAGIYLRGTPQVQMWDTARVKVGAQVGSGGLYNNQVHESKPLKVADNKLGEWNTMYIKMVGDRVTVILNGELVTNDVILENYWNREQPLFPTEQIELQAHGSKVYYRNIYVKELERPEPYQLTAEEKKEGYELLFDGTNMHEWTGNLVDYSIEDGCISLTPDKNFGGNLYTKNQYGDFVFRFEFQLTPAANNGLGIRTPMEGDAAYVGMELQILDSEHPVYSQLHDYQYHGSVYGIIPAKRGYLKPTGEWNYQEVIAKGNHIKITLNGTIILDGDIKDATKNGMPDGKEHPGLFNKKGHIGFLGHGSPVKFRKIRIKKLK